MSSKTATAAADAAPGAPGTKTIDRYVLMECASWAFLTYNSVTGIYQSIGSDPYTVALIVAVYVDLALLFACLNLFHRVPNGTLTKERLKKAIWSLATLLTALFTYRVAAIMPLPVAVVAWGLAVATTLTGFYTLFLHPVQVKGGLCVDDAKHVAVAIP